MAAFFEPNEVLDQVSHVLALADGQIIACKRPGSGLEGIFNDIQGLYWYLKEIQKDASDPKSFLRRCDKHTEDDLANLLDACQQDLEGFEELLSGRRTNRRNGVRPQDPAVQEFRIKLRSHTNSFAEFLVSAEYNAVELMKAQLYTLVEDILCRRRDASILIDVVDWDALAEELNHPATADQHMLELDMDHANDSVKEEVEEILDTPLTAVQAPFSGLPRIDGFKQTQRTTYRAPTVEDYDGEEDESSLLSPPPLTMSSRSSDTVVEHDSRPTTAEYSDIRSPGTSITSPEEDSEDDQMEVPDRQLKRQDTDLLRMERQKLDIKEEIKLLQEQAKVLEQQKKVWETEQLLQCRDYYEKNSKIDEDTLRAECWKVPSEAFETTHYFAMPNGAFWKADEVKKYKTTTPPISQAFRRGSSYQSHNSGSGSGTSTGGNVGSSSSGGRRSTFLSNSLHGSPLHQSPLNQQPPAYEDFAQYRDFLSSSLESGSIGLGLDGGRRTRVQWNDIPIAESPREMSPSSSDRTPTPPQPKPPPPPPPSSRPVLSSVSVIEHPLPVTLEEVFHGTLKSVIVPIEIPDRRRGGTRYEQVHFTVRVKKGIRVGTKLQSPSDEIQGPVGFTQDICFIVEDKYHRKFKRRGSDLYRTVEITPSEAIRGWRREIESICGTKIKVKGSRKTPDGMMQKFEGLGMPRSRHPSKRGDLFVEVRIKSVDPLGMR